MGNNISYSLPNNQPQKKTTVNPGKQPGNSKSSAGSSKDVSFTSCYGKLSAIANDVKETGGDFGISLGQVESLIEKREDKTAPGLSAIELKNMHLDKAYNDELKTVEGRETATAMSQRLAESRPEKNFLNAMRFGSEIKGAVDVNKNNYFDMEDAKYLEGLDKTDGEGIISAKDLAKAEKADIDNSWKPSDDKELSGNSHNLGAAFQEINAQHKTKGVMDKLMGPKHHDYANQGLSYSQLGDIKKELAGLKETPTFSTEQKNQAIGFVDQLQGDRDTFTQISKKSVDWGDSGASEQMYKNDDTLKIYITDLNKM